VWIYTQSNITSIIGGLLKIGLKKVEKCDARIINFDLTLSDLDITKAFVDTVKVHFHSLLKVENFQLQNFFPAENSCLFGKFENFLSAETFPKCKWALMDITHTNIVVLLESISTTIYACFM
jgi:hypothetical protein